MLPMVMLKLKLRRAVRVSVSAHSMPTKSRMTGAVTTMALECDSLEEDTKTWGTWMPRRAAPSASRGSRCWSWMPLLLVAKKKHTSVLLSFTLTSVALSRAWCMRRTSHANRRSSVWSHAWLTGQCVGPQS